MAAQLTCDPIIKITLVNGEVFDEYAPGFVPESFVLTKGLLKPNKFEFVIRKEELTIEGSDIDFDLKDKLLAAMVEVNLKAKYYDVDEEIWIEHDVEDFFYGYIQNIKVKRSNSKPMTFKCVAYSPDARLKKHPTCRSFSDYSLKDCVVKLTQKNTIEKMTKYNPDDGSYGDGSEDGLAVDVQTNTPENYVMPYTVQYNESPYDFLVRMARRYGEFMYYENRELVFGKMKELPEIELRNGTTLEKYEYEMTMNDHSGVIFCEQDLFNTQSLGVGREKKNIATGENGDYKSVVGKDDYQNRMANAAYGTAQDYFVDFENSIVELGSTPHLYFSYENDKENYDKGWQGYQRALLDRYIMTDSLICNGEAARMDLKLGTVLKLKEETNTGEKEEWHEHQPLKVVELSYKWNRDNNLDVHNTFMAVAQDAVAPPYLHHNDDGFMMYGEFDAYPKSGPQYGLVVDNEDPEKLGRVRVCLLWQAANGYAAEDSNYDVEKDPDRWTPWIWVVSPNQGIGHGPLAIPEIGDQVLVGYVRHNVENPYVIGARYAEEDMPGEWTDYEHNNVKGFRSTSGHTIEFIDTDEKFGEGGKIHIYDSNTHNYEITFDTDKKLIRLESKGNIELDARNNIVLHAGKDLIINVDNDMISTVKQDMVANVKANKENNVEGNLNFDVKGNSSSYAEGYQVHRAQEAFKLCGYATDDDSEGLSSLFLNDDAAVMTLFGSRDSDDPKATVGMSKDTIQIATNFPGAIAEVKALNGGDVDIKSDKKNVNVEAGVNVDVKAQVETTINGKIVKIN